MENLNGIYETYYDNGQMYVKCNYKNGKYDGSYHS